MYDPESLDQEPDLNIIDKLSLKYIQLKLWVEFKIKQLLN